MPDECLICGAPLEYLKAETDMTCSLCGKVFPSKTRCVRGHYVCDECDACWESPDQIRKDNFSDLSTYLEERVIDLKSVIYDEYL